jgi:hypothetical protein
MPISISVVLKWLVTWQLNRLQNDLPLLVIKRLTLLEELFDKSQEISGAGLAPDTRIVLDQIRNELLRVIEKTRRVLLGGVLVGLSSLKLFIERHDEESRPHWLGK